ncbi:MAG: hypothetical protein NVS9B14_06590 [Candidatus Acidiferrum sp.]
MKGMLFFAALFLAAMAEPARPDTTYTVKVVVVDQAGGLVEAKFLVLPQDLRIVCHGEAKKIFVGDYAKVEIRDGKFAIGKTVCDQMKWMQ